MPNSEKLSYPIVFDDLVDAINGLSSIAESSAESIVTECLPDEVEKQLPDVIEEYLPSEVDTQLNEKLPEIIEQEVPSMVGDWLGEHVDPSTGYVVDDSLTIQDAAADAKATGDAITDLNSALNQLDNNVSDLADVLTGSKNSSGGVNYDNYPITEGTKYYFKNTGANSIVLSYRINGETGSKFKDPLNAGASFVLTASIDADGFRVYYNGKSSFEVKKGRVEDIEVNVSALNASMTEALSDISVLDADKERQAANLVFSNLVSGGQNKPVIFQKGVIYYIYNQATSGTCNLYTHKDGANVEQIADSLAAGNMVRFVPKYDADYLRINFLGSVTNGQVEVYYNVAETITELGKIIPDIDVAYPYQNDVLYNMAPSGTDAVEYAYGLFDDLMELYPNNITKSVLGQDQSGTYDINCYTIKSYSDSRMPHYKKNKKIAWICAIHGNEKDSTRACYLFLKDMLENVSQKSNLAAVYSNVDFLVVPVANPWGYARNTRYNSRDVNLNRNFPYNWKLVDKNTDPYNYGGTEPSSEAETLVIESFITANADAFIALNQHGSESITDGTKVYYTRSAYYSDYEAQLNVTKVSDDVMKKNNSWLFDVTANHQRNMGASLITNNTFYGTLDGWFNQTMNVHGYLVEIASASGSSYSTTALVMQNLQTSCTGMIIMGSVNQMQNILGSNQHYPRIVSS